MHDAYTSLDRKPPLRIKGWKNEAERQLELWGSVQQQRLLIIIAGTLQSRMLSSRVVGMVVGLAQGFLALRHTWSDSIGRWRRTR